MTYEELAAKHRLGKPFDVTVLHRNEDGTKTKSKVRHNPATDSLTRCFWACTYGLTYPKQEG